MDKTNFDTMSRVCLHRSFGKCLLTKPGERISCSENYCPRIRVEREQTDLLEACVARLPDGQLDLLQALLCVSNPDVGDRRVWNEKARGIITAELEKRNP